MLQFTSSERLDNKENPKRDAWISLWRGNIRDPLCKLGVRKGVMDENMREQVRQAR